MWPRDQAGAQSMPSGHSSRARANPPAPHFQSSSQHLPGQPRLTQGSCKASPVPLHMGAPKMPGGGPVSISYMTVLLQPPEKWLGTRLWDTPTDSAAAPTPPTPKARRTTAAAGVTFSFVLFFSSFETDLTMLPRLARTCYSPASAS